MIKGQIDTTLIMTNEELDKVSKEVDCIAEYLSILDNPHNLMEQKLRDHLWNRWHFLRSQIKNSLAELKRRRFHVVPEKLKH